MATGLICSGWPVRQLRTPTSLIGFFMHATFDYAGCRHAVPNAGASCRIADAPLAMSPAPRAVRDVELAALEHVRPIEPGKQLRLQQPHAAAGNARVEREARRHLTAIGELGEHDLAIGNGERAGPVAIIGFRQRLAFYCGGANCGHEWGPCAHP